MLKQFAAVLFLPVVAGLGVACFSSSSGGSPPSCSQDFSSSVLKCPDASTPTLDAATPRDAGSTRDSATISDATADVGIPPSDAGAPDAEPIEAAPLPTCTGTFGIDTTFGTNGLVVDFHELNGLNAIVVQPDGKYVAGGESKIARYDANGTLDTTFGLSGYLTFESQTYPQAFIIEADGNILVGGSITLNGNMCMLMRLTPSGVVDDAFGGDAGMASCADLSPALPTGFAQIAQRPNGAIVASGPSYPTPQARDFALVQFDSNGIPDSTFGTKGQALAGFPADAPIGPFVLQPDGKAVVTGSLTVDNGNMPSDLAVARFNVDGSLDKTFGTGGRASFAIASANAGPSAVVLQSSGAIVIAAGTDSTTSVFTLVRLMPSGQLDATFGTAGVANVGFFGQGDDSFAVSVEGDDSLLVGGEVGVPTDAGYPLPAYGFVHFLPNGTVDTSFGTGGKYVTGFLSTFDQGATFMTQALQTSGALITLGTGDFLDDAGASVLNAGLLVRYACH